MKTKLVPFNIEKAKQGAKVVTRDNYPVRILCYDLEDSRMPIIAAVRKDGKEIPYQYTIEGNFYPNKEEDTGDLFIEEEEQEKTRRTYSGTDSLFIPKDDEGIKEELIDAINGLSDNDAIPMPLSIKRKEAWLAWLQKQGEKNTADVTPKFKVTPKFTVWNEDENKVKKETKKRRMTNKELSWWLREHPEEHREMTYSNEDSYVSPYFYYLKSEANTEVYEKIVIRKNGGKWQEPLIEM